MRPFSRFDINIRAALTVAVAGIVFLMASDTWAKIVGPVGVMVTGLSGAMLQALRGFLDQSTTQGKAEPIEVTAPPNAPLPVKEVDNDVEVEPDKPP